jgi:hypothetical protein
VPVNPVSPAENSKAPCQGAFIYVIWTNNRCPPMLVRPEAHVIDTHQQ